MQKKIDKYKSLLGLIGYPLSHSFSKKYFADKFESAGINDCFYESFPLENISQLTGLIAEHKNLRGLNVTIPYKEAILPFLDEIDEAAAKIGAVNTILIKNGHLKGYNTDVFGFEQSLIKALKKLKSRPTRALILGTGGAAKAVVFVLNALQISHQFVSRTAGEGKISYKQLDKKIMSSHHLIINTTPLGMSPNIDNLPPIPYQYVGNEHLLFDLIYNPLLTAFLKKGQDSGSVICNGLEMLHLQAEKAWEIWTQ